MLVGIEQDAKPYTREMQVAPGVTRKTTGAGNAAQLAAMAGSDPNMPIDTLETLLATERLPDTE